MISIVRITLHEGHKDKNTQSIQCNLITAIRLKLVKNTHISKPTHPAHILELDVQHHQRRRLDARSLLL
jgi:hypothetical protein